MISSFLRPQKIVKTYSSFLKTRLIKYFLLLSLIFALHIFAMMLFEGMSAMDGLWLTFTSATTVGYGDLYAKTFYGRISTIILLYICGITILAQVAVMYFDYNHSVNNSKLKGNWRWNMKNHIVFLNSPNELGVEYFYQAILQLRRSGTEFANLPIIIVSTLFPEGLPENLQNLKVNYVNKPLSDDTSLEAANIKEAKIIIVLARKELDSSSDGISFDLIDRLKGMGVKGRLIVEVVKDQNRARLKKAGADNVLRPIRAYPGLITRAIVAPGSEQIIESLFDNLGSECVCYDIEIKGKWLDIATSIIEQDLGTLVAYENLKREIILNPSAKDVVEAKSVFIIEDLRKKHSEKVRKVLKGFAV